MWPRKFQHSHICLFICSLLFLLLLIFFDRSSLENVSEESDVHMSVFQSPDVVGSRGRGHPVMQGGLFEEDGPQIEDPSVSNFFPGH